VKGSMDLAGQVDAEEPLFGVDDTVMMGGVRAEVLARFFRSAALVVLGRLAEGEHEMRRALAAAQRDGSDGVFEGHHQALVLWAIQAGFPDQAVAHGRRAAEMSEADRLFTEMGATGHAARLAEEIVC
ncbi:MAG TPA: hypothetical protein VN812_16975, partial [Candidatus Acidoferrales bacterium]|nr:hypothetical protein [Candidatus Acidoferrales bacterium]